MIKITKLIQQVKERMNTTHSRHKSYADRRTSNLDFLIGDLILLTASPWKGFMKFQKRGKLGPRYIGPFRVISRVGKVANRLDLLK